VTKLTSFVIPAQAGIQKRHPERSEGSHFAIAMTWKDLYVIARSVSDAAIWNVILSAAKDLILSFGSYLSARKSVAPRIGCGSLGAGPRGGWRPITAQAID